MWQASTICRATVVSSVLCLPEILNGGGAGGRGGGSGTRGGKAPSGPVGRLTRLRARYGGAAAPRGDYAARRRSERDGQCTAAVGGGGSDWSTVVAGETGARSASRSVRGLGVSMAAVMAPLTQMNTTINGFSALWHADVSARSCGRDGNWEPGVTCVLNDQPACQSVDVRNGNRQSIFRLSFKNDAVKGSQAFMNGRDGIDRDRGDLTIAAASSRSHRDGGNTVEETEAVVGGGSGAGDDGVDDGGSGGDGGRGDGGSGNRGEGGDGSPRKLLMSQVFTLTYAALLTVGGLIGFVKSRSVKSLAAGVGAGMVLLYVSANLPVAPLYASSVGLAVAAMLSVVMGKRYMASKKVFPAGLTALFSLFMTAGYIHGIVRVQRP